MPALHVNDASFDKVINSGRLVLVDFWATWCRPCQMMGPIIDELADEFEGRAIIAKVDADENGDLCSRFGITNIPNMKLFKGGVEVGNIVGAVPKATLQAAIEKNI